jgi:hypothetical protein
VSRPAETLLRACYSSGRTRHRPAVAPALQIAQ